MIDGVSGVGDATKVVTGNSLGLIRTLPQLAGKDWSCVTLVVTPRDAGGTTLDQLNVPLFFDGYGPPPAAAPQPSAPVSNPAPTSQPSASTRTAAPLLMSVGQGRGFASATVDVATRSTLSGQLRRGSRIVGSKRVTVSGGTQRIKVSLQQKVQRQLRRRGIKRVTLKLRIVVVAKADGTRKSFTRRVVVRV